MAVGLVNERDITNQLGGRISETLRGSSSANVSGISAGFGTGGQGSGGTGAYGGSGSAVLGIAGGFANANSTAAQDSSRDVSQFFGEKLRQSIMQNAEGYRQLNASVVTTVQEGQRYSVTSEVVANHNHCHALTMMYFEVLRHYAIFQELSSVEECVFVPLLLTRFSTENIAKWRDVLAPSLLPLPSETYLQSVSSMDSLGWQHPLTKAFDAIQRIKSHYASVDFPQGAYDDEPIRFVKGEVLLRVKLPRPKSRYDRILSFPIVTSTTTTTNTGGAVVGGAAGGVAGSIIGSIIGSALIPGLGTILGAIAGGAAGTAAGASIGADTTTTVSLVKQQIFDSFMQLDANFQTTPPAQCIRIRSFQPATFTFGAFTIPISGADFFDKDLIDRQQWTAYAVILGYSNVFDMLDNYFAGRLISEWDHIFHNEIATVIFDKIVSSIKISEIATDFTSESQYTGGERLIRLFVNGTTSKKRNQLPLHLTMASTSAEVKALRTFVVLNIENVRISYSTAHYNGLLFSGNINDDLLDETILPIPENSEEKRNPRREDRYLAAKLIEHLNSNLEYYNKVLWYSLDPDRRFMLLDGFSIQIFDDQGIPIPAGLGGLRSLASVVKNDLIGVVGNSLVFPVAPGYRVNKSYIVQESKKEEDRVTLFDHYKPLTPIQPYRISVPTRGVFAEAVQGACNACEKIETERLQDWNKFPIGNEPTSIAPVVPPTPVVTDWKAAFKDFATPIVNIQNAPATPAPGEGLANLTELLGKSGVFKDITGLEGNQQNVIRTFLSNQENAKAFAEMAKEMAMQQHNTQNTGKIMDSIKSAKNDGAISPNEYGKLVKDHLQQQIDGGKTQPALTAGDSKLADVTADVVRSGKPVDATQSFPDGTVATLKQNLSESTLGKIDFIVPGVIPSLRQPSPDTCWAAVAAMLQAWRSSATGSVSVASEIAKLGAPYTQLLSNDQKLVIADKNRLFAKLGLIIDPIGLSSAMPDQYLRVMQRYGPLWATVDGDLTAKTSEHAKLIYGIRGDGTPSGTMLRIVDPRNGARIEQSFEAFMREFEELTRTDSPIALKGQIARFTDPISGEGATANDVFDVLTGLVRDVSMGLTANPAAKLMPVPTGTNPYSFDHNWSGGWTGKTVVSTSGINSTAFEFPLEHTMNGTKMTMPFRVLDTMSWANARVTFEGDEFALPLTRRFLIAADSANAPLSMKKGGAPMFPLEAIIQSHLTLLFGFVADIGTGAVVPLDLTNAPAAGLDIWLRNGGSSAAVPTNKRAVLAVYDLTMNEPSADFQPKQMAPKSPGLVARFYPLLSVWCANACEKVAADLSITRPATSAMTENMMPGARIRGSFYTDKNEDVNTIWDDLDDNLQRELESPSANPIFTVMQLASIIAAWKLIPSPRWNSIFAHYRIGSDMPAITVVDRAKGRRTNPPAGQALTTAARKEMKTLGAAYVGTAVTKVEGQGAFDNIHMAPEMTYKGMAASMAPICQHDCLHLHWRWSEKFSDYYTWGFDGGVPYSKAGAPMIPENQNLDVSLTGTTFKYLPVATQAGAMQWQVFMHHGLAYATALTFTGDMLPMIEISSLTQFYPLPPWEQFYYHNRFWETGGGNRGGDLQRLDEGPNQSNFAPLESM